MIAIGPAWVAPAFSQPVPPLAPAGEAAFSAGPALPSVPSSFDWRKGVQPSWGSGDIPKSAAPDVVGAFRFICSPAQVLADDPIVYPGQPGKSHLHQFFGNTEATANSTFVTLRSKGSSTCNAGDFPLNRSSYWMPAMLDGKGNVVKPDYISIYYKRRPIHDPKCSLSSGDSKAEGNCVPLPNGLRFVFGFDMLDPRSAPTGAAYFNCDGKTAKPGHYATIALAAANCPTARNDDGSFNRLGAVIGAPDCWDGKHLDSPNHRSHVAYPDYGDRGFLRCPKSHPFVIPTFTLGVWYTVDENVGGWRLASDDMMPGAPAGSTFHADWWGAWDEHAAKTWMDHCINQLLNCSGGDMGNGQQLAGAAQPPYGWGVNPDRLVPLDDPNRNAHAH
jgi:hypothetical protein